jgi:hypothetical protein
LEDTRALAKKLDAVGWGLFLIWLGIALLANVGWGAGLLGVGVIALGTQVARKSLGLPFERFGLVIGIVFIMWGIWELLQIQLGKTPIPGLLPILFIVVGIALVVYALRRVRRR